MVGSAIVKLKFEKFRIKSVLFEARFGYESKKNNKTVRLIARIKTISQLPHIVYDKIIIFASDKPLP